MRLVDVMLSLPTLFVILVAAEVPRQGHGDDDHRHLRPVQLDGRQPPRAQPVPVDPRARVRRGGHRRRRVATGGSSSGTSCPTRSARSWSRRRCIVAGNIIAEAFVSFLGFGVDPTSPTWGNILSGGLQFIALGNWWWPLFPGLAIIITVLAVNFVGDGLRDAFDPRSRA